MTLPNLIAKNQEQATVGKLKKAHATFSSAYTRAAQENGDPRNWNLISYADPDGAVNLINTLAPYLNITKNCGKNPGCYAVGQYRQLSGARWSFLGTAFFASAQLADGTIITSYIYSNTCDYHWGGTVGASSPLYNVCADISIDINGLQQPNQYGVDMFIFFLTKTGIFPAGMKGTSLGFDTVCKDKTLVGTGYANGGGCTAWVIYNENMDYLHCSDLAWGGKTKCN